MLLRLAVKQENRKKKLPFKCIATKVPVDDEFTVLEQNESE